MSLALTKKNFMWESEAKAKMCICVQNTEEFKSQFASYKDAERRPVLPFFSHKVFVHVCIFCGGRIQLSFLRGPTLSAPYSKPCTYCKRTMMCGHYQEFYRFCTVKEWDKGYHIKCKRKL